MTRKPLIGNASFTACILAACGFAVLCALGVWQLHRLEWKTGLVAQLEAAQNGAPQTAGAADLSALPPHTRIQIDGVYLNAATIYLNPRTRDGAIGVEVLTPLRLQDGGILIVNRGWASSPSGATMADAAARVTGILSDPLRGNLFTPPNDLESGQWYIADMNDIARVLSPAPVYLKILYAQSESPPAPEGLHPVQPYGDIRNNHFGYAVFWFAMAAALGGVFYVRFLWRGTKNSPV